MDIDFRIKSLGIFEDKPMPDWGGDLSKSIFKITYYISFKD